LEQYKHLLIPELKRNYWLQADLDTYQRGLILLDSLESIPKSVKHKVLIIYHQIRRRLRAVFNSVMGSDSN
jgi:hypothetical protein